MRGTAVHIVFDGGCGFCRRALAPFQTLNIDNSLQFHDGRRRDIVARFPQLAGADLADAMFAVVAGEPVHRGFFAFRRMMWTSPWSRVLLPIMYAPGASLVGPWVYSLIARNRSVLGGGSAACEPPAGSRRR